MNTNNIYSKNETTGQEERIRGDFKIAFGIIEYKKIYYMIININLMFIMNSVALKKLFYVKYR